MDSAHTVRNVSVSGCRLRMEVDGVNYDIDLSSQSRRIAAASPSQQARIQVSPSGYGLHWPDLDEDLSIDGLIGVRRDGSMATAAT